MHVYTRSSVLSACTAECAANIAYKCPAVTGCGHARLTADRSATVDCSS